MLRFLLRRSRAGQRGTALIEFALVLPFVILLTFIVVDLARAFMIKSMLEQSAREGARMYAAIDDHDAAWRRVKLVAGAAGLDSSKVTVALDNGSSKGDPVTCTASASFKWLYPGLFNFLKFSGPGNSVPVSGAGTYYREY